MPLDRETSGYLILGKKVKSYAYHLSAFAIPYACAIYTPPGIIHNDSFLVGRHAVIYAQTKNFSTVRLLDSKTTILPTQIVNLQASHKRKLLYGQT